MAQPVCLPCGHSVCKCCLYKLRSSFTLSSILCPQCKHTCPHKPPGQSDDRKPTLVLQNAFQKWYPRWLEACKYREEGNRFAQEGDFPLAVHWYNKAADTGVMDHRVLGNRSRSYLAMEQLEEALRDAELCCKLRPSWAKGHLAECGCEGREEVMVVPSDQLTLSVFSLHKVHADLDLRTMNHII